MVQEILIELSIGETIQVGQSFVTVKEINGDELCIEIDDHRPGNHWPDKHRPYRGDQEIVREESLYSMA